MPLWIDAIGVTCIGVFIGYLFTFSLRRLLPPITPDNGSLLGRGSLVALFASVGMGGVIGTSTALLPEVRMVGPYGIGLVIGLVINTAILIWLGTRR